MAAPILFCKRQKALSVCLKQQPLVSFHVLSNTFLILMYGNVKVNIVGIP